MKKTLQITHVITDLDVGGAEMMLYKLLSELDPAEFSSRVISLRGEGPIAEHIRNLGVPVEALNMPPGIPQPSGIMNLTRLLQDHQPDVIQTWMYHSDLLGGLSARFSGRPPVVWNIRNSTLDPQTSKRTTLWTVKALAHLSHRWPARIISCSETARDLHVGLGYNAEKMTTIPNGFDLSRFQPDIVARQSLRAELRLPAKTILIGAVGRFDPQKDYPTLIMAADRLHAERPNVHFLLCGNNLTEENEELMGWLTARNLQPVFHLLGRRGDVPRITAALDIATSSSAYGEAFSNVIGEAMACGVPFVATDVGDAALILGKTGKVIPPREPAALADAWQALLSLSDEKRATLGAAARQRIQTHFSLPIVAGQYAALYRDLAENEY
jgi:glycosyltransferase involved in cell wall biosynthesis